MKVAGPNQQTAPLPTRARLRDGLLAGAIAGLVGGIVLGGLVLAVGEQASLAYPLRSDPGLGGWIGHALFGAFLGAGFGAFVWRQRPGAGETFFWGLAYGFFWWFLGPLTIVPLSEGRAVAWDVHEAQRTFPDLLAHLLYGASTGLALATLRQIRDRKILPPLGAFASASAGGLLSAWLLGVMLESQGRLMEMTELMPEMMTNTVDTHSPGAARAIVLLLGLVSGAIFAWLYPRPLDGAGVGLVRGGVFGVFVWVAGARTVIPLAQGSGLDWSLSAVQADFQTLPGFFLFGAALALLYQVLHGLVSVLFTEETAPIGHEAVGPAGLRALGRGALAGLVGGLVFSLVMVQIGFLPAVAGLVGSGSVLTGFVVHMSIALTIGMSYGLLFRRQTYDVGTALGWGLSYGFFWWVLGALTLMPVLLGSAPTWSVGAAADAFPAL
ncbi:MAG: hypothetical protein ACE5NC_08470, partial [Anaerolineae bacterium]